MDSLKMTPWEVSGKLDDAAYRHLIEKFGVDIISKELMERLGKVAGGELHPFLATGLFFAHRDLNLILDDYDAGRPFYLYTGRGPSGKMHIGHLLPFIFTKWLQDVFGVHLLVQFTDDEKYLIKSDRSKKEVETVANENVLDVLSLGFDPKKTHIIKDYDNAKTLYYYATDVAKHTTISTIKAVFGVVDSDNIGKVFFPSMQIVPAFILSAITGKNIRCLIPYAIDQDPYFRVSRDVLPKLGYYKPSAIISKFLPSLQGQNGKMSSSIKGSAIFLDDDEDSVKRKMMKYAFSGGKDTVAEQRKYGANPDVDFAFNAYAMFEDDPAKIRQVYDDYKSGRMLSGEMKELSARKINERLAEMRRRRKVVEKDVSKYTFDPSKFKDL